MGFAKGRSTAQIFIEEGHTILEHFIKGADTLFTSELTSIKEEKRNCLEDFYDPEPEIQQDYYSSIELGFEEVEQAQLNLILSSRRVLLIAISSYFERNLKQILELYGIKPKGKKGKGKGKGSQGPIINQLLDFIEKQKGALPTTSNSLKNTIFNDLRCLRNHCIHDAVHDAVKAQTDIDSVINKNPALSFLDGELHIKDIQVLLNYLNASKEFLEIIEEHCRNNP